MFPFAQVMRVMGPCLPACLQEGVPDTIADLLDSGIKVTTTTTTKLTLERDDGRKRRRRKQVRTSPRPFCLFDMGLGLYRSGCGLYYA